LEFQKLKKLFCVVPKELFDELDRRGILKNDFDNWMISAISEKLEREKGA